MAESRSGIPERLFIWPQSEFCKSQPECGRYLPVNALNANQPYNAKFTEVLDDRLRLFTPSFAPAYAYKPEQLPASD